jgi:catechol 2,3-dioxygenase-like lactoylglutathione lyase family enzyme
MSRVQLSINVSDFDAAVAFYSRLFGTAPAKLRPVYEVASTGDVADTQARLVADGLATEAEPGAVCCYARQDEVWTHDPDGVAWEHYTVLEHVETP